MNALMWWDFSPRKGLRNHLMNAASVPLVNAWPVQVIDPDGKATIDEMQLHTRAFLKGDTLTIYALNLNPSKEWKDLRFKLATGRIVGAVEARQWADGYPAEGVTATYKAFAGSMFNVDLAPRTINVFSCNIKP
jgi:hypothetical protein